MKKLRDKTIEKIMGLLDASLFTRHGFETHFHNTDTGETICIVFTDKPEFKFVAIEQPYGDAWTVKASPGNMFVDETNYRFNTFTECIDGIEDWLRRILEELVLVSKAPAVFQQIRENLRVNSEGLDEPYRPFTEEESVQWEKRLDLLVAQFEELQEQEKIQQSEVDFLKREVQVLKEKLTTIPKRTWVKSAGNKIIDIIERLANTEAAKVLAEGAAKFLLGGGSG